MSSHILRLEDEHKLLVRQLRLHGQASRSELASRIGTSNAALTKVSRELLTLGLIEEVSGEEVHGRGRPAVPLRVSALGGYAVGATLHKGMLSIALVNYAGRTIATAEEPFASADPRVFAGTVRRRMYELADRHHMLGVRLLGVGVGVPAPIRSLEKGHWHLVEELAPWRDIPLGEVIAEEVGLPVWIENDANAAALAEYYIGGVLRNHANMVTLLLGYGLGAGVILDRRLHRGEYGKAGEIGIFIPSSPRPSTLDLLATLRADGCDISSIGDFENATREFGPTIDAWVARAAKQLQPIVNGALVWFDPGAIVISSPLPKSLLTRLAQRLNGSELLQVVPWMRSPEVRVSDLGSLATTLGAALLPIHASTET